MFTILAICSIFAKFDLCLQFCNTFNLVNRISFYLTSLGASFLILQSLAFNYLLHRSWLVSMHFFFTSLHIMLFLLPDISLSLHIALLTILCFMPIESSNSSPFSKFRFHSISQCLGSFTFLLISCKTIECKLGPNVKDYGL